MLATAAYPMVDEHEATGAVADVYAQLLARMPMVPSLFKSLAVCPPYLIVAWQQAAAALDTEAFGAAAQELAALAGQAVPPHADREVRRTLGRFVAPLSRMLLVTAGLQLALDGALDGQHADGVVPPRTEQFEPELAVPATGELDAELVGQLRRGLRTPLINSIWRVAWDRGQLEAAWQHVAPHVDSVAASQLSAEVRDGARASAATLHWPIVATVEALGHAGAPDARPGVDAILEAYALTLPRVLTLVASNVGQPSP